DRPQLDFSVERNCLKNGVLFTDLSSSPQDPIVTRTWDFGGLGVATGEQTAFEFPRTGTYTVSLTVETSNGCTYSESRQVTIVDPPEARFEFSPSAGAPPLAVRFSNLSVNAVAYEWYIDDVLISTEEELTYTFSELGIFAVRLVAISREGCRDETGQSIPVVEPEVDLAALEILPIRNDGMMMFRLSAANYGNVPVNEFPVELVLSDQVTLFDVAEIGIEPGGTSSVLLPFRVADRNFDFACVSIGEVISNFGDLNPDNNSACFVFSGNQLFSVPFPNPASNIVSFRVYADAPGTFGYRVINLRRFLYYLCISNSCG
ncbi:MAG: PKD domain-containing protein, partial [Cyclobacteriaceae bacterium]